MQFFLQFLLIGDLFLQIASLRCLNGSQQVPGENICMYASTDVEFYNGGSRRCIHLNGMPAKIKNIFENSFLLAIIPESVATYIGVEKQKGDVWTYADGTTLTYSNWASGEPAASNCSICATMIPQTGKWMAAECGVARPFFCSINGLPDLPCPDGWSYNENTTNCYYVQNFTYTNEQKWKLYDWPTAEKNCQQMNANAHLVSMHSYDESNFVYDLVTTNMANATNEAPNQDACLYQQAWIGYAGNGTIGTGNWTDNSLVDFIDQTFVFYLYYWTITNDPSCMMHYWGPWLTTDKFARYVCKMPSKSV